jgi:Uma2 family endonuclease
MLFSKPDLLLRSTDASWDRARWATLGDDGNRYEVLNGVLYMSTVSRPLHQLVSRLLQQQCYRQLDDQGYGITLHAPLGLFMPGCDPVQPDLLVIRAADLGIIRDEGIEGIPALLVEILSQATRNYDLVAKCIAYARAGVPEYWVFRPNERDALIHCDPEPASGLYLRVTHIPPDGELVSPTLPFRALVSSFFPNPRISSSDDKGWPPAFNPLPPPEERHASLERLGVVVKGILASTGMTEDELVDALTREDWSPSNEDSNDEEQGTDPSLRSG